MKRIFILLFISVIVLSFTMSFAVAENQISPYYDRIGSAGVTFSITNGTAKCNGSITPNPVAKTSITVKLQKRENGKWYTIRIWSGSNSKGASEAGGTKQIETGYIYRATATGKIYDSNGKVVESITKISPTRSY